MFFYKKLIKINNIILILNFYDKVIDLKKYNYQGAVVIVIIIILLLLLF